jgi:hypothetical protein
MLMMPFVLLLIGTIAVLFVHYLLIVVHVALRPSPFGMDLITDALGTGRIHAWMTG